MSKRTIQESDDDDKWKRLRNDLIERYKYNNDKEDDDDDDNEGELSVNDSVYETNSCTLMLAKMNDFLPKCKSKIDYKIINNCTKEQYTNSYSTYIPIKDYELFSETGHCFSIDFTTTYIIPLILDLDCISCKEGKCEYTIKKEYVMELREMIKHLIYELLNVYIDCVIFKREICCNLHIYFNISVSLILYDIIIEYLKINLPQIYIKKYIIDNVSTIGLPYSAKNDNDPYLPYCFSNNEYKMFNTVPSLNFYDVKIKIAHNIDVMNNEIKFGSFEQEKAKFSDWIVQKDKTYLLYLKNSVQYMSQQNTIIRNIKNSNINISSTIKNLEKYINEVIVENKTIIHEHIEKYANKNPEIYSVLLDIGKKVANIIYNNKSVQTGFELSYVYKFIIANNCSLSFYCFMSIYAYILDYCNINEPDMSIKIALIDILILMCRQAVTDTHLHIIFRMLIKLYKFKIDMKLLLIFKDYERWFNYLKFAIQIKNNSVLDYFKQITKIFNNLDELNDHLIDFLQISIPLLQQQPDYYYYSKGLYYKISEQELNRKSNVNFQMLFTIQLRKLLEFYINSNFLSEDLTTYLGNKEFFHKFISELFVFYKVKAQSKTVFNSFDYFISTNYGIFNTITGLYMEFTPLLLFNTKKNYCVSTSKKHKTLLELNADIIDIEDYYEEVCNILLKKQNFLYYNTILIPGLLTLYKTFLRDNEIDSILDMIQTRFENDNEKLADNLYGLYKVYKLYNISSLYLMNVAYKIYNAKTLDIYKLKEYKNKTFPKTLLKNTDDVKEFLSDIYEKYKEINSTNIAFAIIIIVLDYCSLQILYKQYKQMQTICENPIQINNSNNIESEYGYDIYHKILKQIYPNITDTTIHMCHTFSVLFEFNNIIMSDILNVASTIYRPNCERKQMLLFIGTTKSGKSTLQKLFMNINEGSLHSTENELPGSKSSSPSPDIIQITQSYLLNVSELSVINTKFFKTITGGDKINKRTLYESRFEILQPIVFCVAASNEIPRIHDADEAIRERLAPFYLRTKFLNRNDVAQTNVLILHMRKLVFGRRDYNIELLAREMSNILYFHFVFNMKFNNIQKIVNNESNTAINDCLLNNNYIYKIIKAAGIIFNPSLSIRLDELKGLITQELNIYSKNRNIKITWENFECKFKIMFMNHLNHIDGNVFRGIGVKDEIEDVHIKEPIFQFYGTVSDDEIIKKLLIDNKYIIDSKITEILQKYYNEYNKYYNKKEKRFIGMSMIE